MADTTQSLPWHPASVQNWAYTDILHPHLLYLIHGNRISGRFVTAEFSPLMAFFFLFFFFASQGTLEHMLRVVMESRMGHANAAHDLVVGVDNWILTRHFE